MPTPYENAPTVTRTFADVTVAVPAIFREGDALTAAEAKWANTMVGTVVGNAFGSRVRKALEAENAARAKAFKAKSYTGPLGKDGKPAKATVADVFTDPAAEFAKQYAAYELGAGRAHGEGKSASDPIASLIRSLATIKVKALIQSKGKKVKEFTSVKITTADGEEITKFTALVNDYIERHGDALRESAERQVAELNTSAEGDDDLLAA